MFKLGERVRCVADGCAIVCARSRVTGLGSAEAGEELVSCLSDLARWAAAKGEELSRQRPVGGDLTSIRQQLDTLQVSRETKNGAFKHPRAIVIVVDGDFFKMEKQDQSVIFVLVTMCG